MTKPITFFLAVVGLLSASEAQAQHIFHRGIAHRGAVAASAPAGITTAPTPRTYPYSYYAAYPGPARGYEGYGPNDFPFYGAPYGHPYDRWTWPYLSNASNSGLARYYDPPVK